MHCTVKLSILFVSVLSVAVISSSITACALTYSASHQTIKSIARRFRELAENQSESIRAVANSSTAHTISLVSDARAQQRLQVDDLLHKFRDLFTGVNNETARVTATYASAFRLELVHNLEATLRSLLEAPAKSNALVAQNYHNGFGDWALPRYEYAGAVLPGDCAILQMLCDIADSRDAAFPLFLGTEAHGRVYWCGCSHPPNWCGAYVYLNANYTRPDGTRAVGTTPFIWRRYGPGWRQRCLTEPPARASASIAPDCAARPAAERCDRGRCGYDPRCRFWYQVPEAAPGAPPAPVVSRVQPSWGRPPCPVVTLSLPVYNATSGPRRRVGVSAVSFYFSALDAVLRGYPAPPTTRMCVVLDGPALTLLGTRTGNSAALVADAEGGPELQTLSLWDSADAPTRAVGRWLQPRQGALTGRTHVALEGYLWDIFPSRFETLSYLVIVGMSEEEVLGGIARAEAQALAELDATTAAARAGLAAADAAVRDAIGRAEAELVGQLHRARDAQRAAVAASRARGLQLLDSNALRTAAAVVGLLGAVLLVGALGTVSLTRRLAGVIGVMEEVVALRFECLEVPRGSRVTEVARLQGHGGADGAAPRARQELHARRPVPRRRRHGHRQRGLVPDPVPRGAAPGAGPLAAPRAGQRRRGSAPPHPRAQPLRGAAGGERPPLQGHGHHPRGGPAEGPLRRVPGGGALHRRPGPRERRRRHRGPGPVRVPGVQSIPSTARATPHGLRPKRWKQNRNTTECPVGKRFGTKWALFNRQATMCTNVHGMQMTSRGWETPIFFAGGGGGSSK